MEIDQVWHKNVQKLCEKYNKAVSKSNTEKISEILGDLIAILRNFDTEEKKEKLNYILRWEVADALKKVARNQPDYLGEYLHDLEYLSENGYTPDIQERAHEILEAINKPVQRIPAKISKRKKIKKKIVKKIKRDRIRDLQNILNSGKKIKIKTIAKKFNITPSAMESWLMELLEDGIISGEITELSFIPLKKVDYDQLQKYQSNSENQCAICFQPIEIQEPSFCPSCNAFFHKSCILEYAKRMARCPVCSDVLRWI